MLLEDGKFKDRFGFAKPSVDDTLVFVSQGETRAIELAESAERVGFKNVFGEHLGVVLLLLAP